MFSFVKPRLSGNSFRKSVIWLDTRIKATKPKLLEGVMACCAQRLSCVTLATSRLITDQVSDFARTRLNAGKRNSADLFASPIGNHKVNARWIAEILLKPYEVRLKCERALIKKVCEVIRFISPRNNYIGILPCNPTVD